MQTRDWHEGAPQQPEPGGRDGSRNENQNRVAVRKRFLCEHAIATIQCVTMLADIIKGRWN